MSYDYERYDGKRIVVDGEIIGLLAMEYGHEVEAVFDEYHAEVALTPEQERQAEAYRKNLRTTLCAQYKKVDVLQAENTKLQERIAELEELLPDSGRWFSADTVETYVAENVKLRELARRFGEYVSQDRCDGCVMKRRCNNGDVEECWQMTEIRALANELGIEV